MNRHPARQRFIGRSFLALLILIAVLAAAACHKTPENPPAPAASAPAASVDDARLVGADDDTANWLTYGRTYSEQRFSPLKQIDTANIKDLGLAWWYELKVNRGVEATPLVVDGVMYVTSAWSMVYALDAKTGKELWFFDPKVPRERGQQTCCDVVNRGVAVWRGKVYVGTIDGRLIALDAKAGSAVWEKLTVDQTIPYSITGAPRVAKGMVFIGNGGGEFGLRGYVGAYDAETGSLRWRFYTVPGGPAKGPDGAASDKPLAEIAAKTWHGEWWKLGGGGTVWDSIVYDPELDLVYIGVDNGGPDDQNVRSPGGGDNLFISSIVALRADTGEYVWHYQTTPGDVWDSSSSQQMMLVDLTVDGKARKLLWQAPKNGFFYVLDRTNGELLSAKPYTTVTWATGIEMKTGRPIEAKNARYPGGMTVILAPAIVGGHNWQPMAYSPATALVYIPVTDMPMPWSSDPLFTHRPGWWNTAVPGPTLPPDSNIVAQIRASARSYLRAWDPVAQKEAWSVPLNGPWNGGVLATAGGLVFQGTADGRFVAYDAGNGTKVWETRTNTATLAGPISYWIDGEQYVAVPGGYGSSMFLALGALMPPAVPRQLGRVMVYKLGGKATLPAEQQIDVTLPAPPALHASEATVRHGSDVYQTFCWPCHGASAISSGVLPDLRHSPILQDGTAWKSIVLDGVRKDNGMASFSKWMNLEDAEAVRAYVAAEAARAMPATAASTSQ
jgi:PQQ-dependent dehydrogenase (methanol/ethanol family)